jgi:phosphopantothenoylcysteine decarboxylase/phosphopantothenate--cysteine ligase
MWDHPATQRNVATLRSDGRVQFVGPVDGPLASGESGMGRLAEPDAIVTAALLAMAAERGGSRDATLVQAPTRDLHGYRVIVSAGPTVEDIDPVRFLSNRSTGRMGFAVAERAAARGAVVTLVTGPVELATPTGVKRVDVRGAREMKAALDTEFGPQLDAADALIMTAAVADYAPREQYAHKMKKAGDAISLDLVKNPDLLAEIGAARNGTRPVLVGFAVETAEPDILVAYAQKKLREKKVDIIVANPAAEAFAAATNRATFVTENAADAMPLMSKNDLADQILDRVRSLFTTRGIKPC